MIRDLTHEFDTLLFLEMDQAADVLEALETGLDQVVGICVLHSEPASAEPLQVAKSLIDEADRMDLPVFVDTRNISDLGAAGLGGFPGAVCRAGQVKFLRKTLTADATLVVDAGISRHEAMVGAESGADAVLFRASPDQIAAEIYPGDDEGPQNVADLYAWWEQVMEPPAILDLDSLEQEPSWMKHVEFVATKA